MSGATHKSDLHHHDREILSDKPGRAFASVGNGRSAMEPQTEWHRFEKHKFAREMAKVLDAAAASRSFACSGSPGQERTTLAKHFAESVSGTTLFGAFAGKAAYVLRQKGCPGATTIHSMIYKSREKGKARLKELEMQIMELGQELRAEGYENPDEHRRMKELKAMLANEKKDQARPMFSLNYESAVKDAALVVIDECSMVDETMGNDLLYFEKPILVLGDPFQLPPVGGAGYFTEDCKPDVMLTDIQRQAKDNPIVAMATAVREGRSLNLGRYGHSRVVEGSSIGRGRPGGRPDPRRPEPHPDGVQQPGPVPPQARRLWASPGSG